MQLRITIAMCMVEIRNRKTLQSKGNICKSDVKIGDYADSLPLNAHVYLLGPLVGQLSMGEQLYVYNFVSYGMHFVYKIILF